MGKKRSQKMAEKNGGEQRENALLKKGERKEKRKEGKPERIVKWNLISGNTFHLINREHDGKESNRREEIKKIPDAFYSTRSTGFP